MAFADALRAINTMKAEGVIEEYAPSRPGAVVSLEGIYRWASSHGYTAHKEHVIIEGVPTQFLASPGPAGDEAIETAATLEYEDVPTRVVLPEYLVVLYLQPGPRTTKRRERAAMLLEWPGLNRERLDAILKQHGLSF